MDIGKIVKFSLAASALIGATAAIVNTCHEASQEKGTAVPFDRFLDNQHTVDTFTLTHLVDWARRFKGQKDVVCTAFYPTSAMQEMLRLTDIPAELDAASNILLLAMNTRTQEIHDTRMISFGSVSEQIKTLFGTNDYIMMEGNENE